MRSTEVVTSEPVDEIGEGTLEEAKEEGQQLEEKGGSSLQREKEAADPGLKFVYLNRRFVNYENSRAFRWVTGGTIPLDLVANRSCLRLG